VGSYPETSMVIRLFFVHNLLVIPINSIICFLLRTGLECISFCLFLWYLFNFFIYLGSYGGSDKESLCDSLVRNTIAVYNTVITQVNTSGTITHQPIFAMISFLYL